MMKIDKSHPAENFKKSSEEITLIAVIIAAFFTMYAINKMEPKTIIINQAIPTPQVNLAKVENVALPMPVTATKGDRMKLEVPSVGKKSSDGTVQVPQVPVLPRPLNVSSKADYERLIVESNKAEASSGKASTPIGNGNKDNDGAGVYVVFRNKNNNSTETEKTNADPDAVNIIIGSKEKTKTEKPEVIKTTSKENSDPEKPKNEAVSGLQLKLATTLSSIPKE